MVDLPPSLFLSAIWPVTPMFPIITTNTYSWNENVQQHPAQNIPFSNNFTPLLLIHRFMQQLEDALNVSLCGHFLILLAAMCFTAFSIVTVQYKNCCMQ
jgi:thiosulfate reductase cytochrome b subunit